VVGARSLSIFHAAEGIHGSGVNGSPAISDTAATYNTFRVTGLGYFGTGLRNGATLTAMEHDPIVHDQPDPVIEAYKKDVDRTLLRQNLKRTVEERFRAHQQLLEFAAKFRGVTRRRS
jgi:hypothetical protein